MVPTRSLRIRMFGGLLLVSLTALLFQSVRFGPSGGAATDRPNVLLLSIDTLRADHLGSYGYDRPTSPILDRLADRSVRFEEAWAPAPWTLPSHAGMLTGIHPRRLGIANRESTIPKETRLLAELLYEEGYRTAAFVDSMPGGFVGAGRGFARGFEEYTHLPAEVKSRYRYDMEVTADRAIEWLASARRRREPFFLFLHTKSVHALPGSGLSPDPRRFPYDRPEPYRSRFLTEEGLGFSWVHPELGSGVALLRNLNEGLASGKILPDEIPEARREALRGLYDGGILYVDHHFGRVLDELERSGLASRTIIVVTADHGESFLDHHLFLHKEVYRQTLRVPLFVYRPGGAAPRVVSHPVALLDLAPTILSLAGAETPAGLDGIPLPLDGEGGPALSPRAFFSYCHARSNDYYEGYSLREGDFTLVHHRLGRGSEYRTELYDARHDPHERVPLGDRPDLRAGMLRRLKVWKESGAAAAPELELDAETLDHLRALGYAD